ncbi:serine hydrolase domain-containing protein [Kitasatospora viridis]|uniref:D-alanyl-D-alanine carboxypeptidase n=1 Tax=Kitasatospora viridis TaxID=281105 RepID=A0A561TT96_9ACTN|nr:serine hydrolase domain-containing protein [Kitasatospora viridis]TWF90339.1 D-alanyl-D-alanine carboxypeptidase [Kitasatospora viridis]
MNSRTTPRLGRSLAAGLLAGATVLAFAPGAGAAAPSGQGPAGAGRTDSAGLQQALDAITSQAGALSAIAEVRENGKVTWRGSTGVGDLATKAPAPVDGRFRAGSVTKTFVATVALQLSAEGRIGLDDPIEHYLPGAVPNGGAITVREVLNHTAGIFDYLEDPQFAGDTEAEQEQFVATDRWKTYTPQQLVAIATSHPPYFAPGQGWHYSNTDYQLIAEVIDKVTGHSWRTEVRDRILRPLGLRHTSLPGTATTIPGPHAHAYLPLTAGPADVTDLNASQAGPAGELISTTDDLARFNAALLGGRLLAPAQLAEMTTTVAADVDPPTRYGLGLMRISLPCGDFWGHPGGIYNYTTYVFGDRSGTRQVAISVTPYDPAKSAELNPTVFGLMGRALCPTGAGS